jgi:hypothetical protein
MKNVNKINSITKTIVMSSLSLLSLTSCEPTTYYKKIIENKSSKTLTVLIENQDSFPIVIDTLQINAGKNQIIIASEDMGYSDRAYSDCKNGSPIYYIHPIDSNAVSIENSPDWILDHTDKNNGLKHWVNCRFVVTDETY